MADEGVIDSTVTEFKAHPWLIGGGIAALVVLFYFLSGSGKTSAGQDFKFSYGPSDAQVQAGTALAISQQQDTTALALAGMSATAQANTTAAQTTVAGQAFGYLTNASANQLAATQITSAAGVAMNANNDQTAQAIANYNLTGQIAAGSYATQTAQINASAATTIAGQNAAAQTTIAGLQYNSADFVAQNTNAAAVTMNAANNATAVYTNAANNATAVYTNGNATSVSMAGIASNERLGANAQNIGYAENLAQIASTERLQANQQAWQDQYGGG
jgi:hypothetical protein